MKTVLHTFSFDTTKPEEKKAWKQFKAERESGPHCFGPVLSDVYSPVLGLDGTEIELDPGQLFENQWNTTGGVRVFDFALQSDCAPHSKLSAPHGIRRGHYLEQTPEMREVRRNTVACGYCGHQESAARGSVFCPKCLGCAYLKESDLPLLRLRAIDENRPGNTRPALTEAERAHLWPLYVEAQTERRDRAAVKERAKIREKAKTAIERDGMLWLLDNGIPVDNVIYYSHTGKFCFGWRGDGLEESIVSALLDRVSEFPFPYQIKTANGRTLEGH